jgi:hypothetical protein
MLVPKFTARCKKGRPIMRTSPQSAYRTPPIATPNIPQPGLWAERTYQGLTVAAMLWILGSLWLFR